MGTGQEILKVLESKRGSSVSGEELAEQVGITRAAVWKHIKKLRADGYVINAVKNSGYCLSVENDKLSAAGILPYLKNPESAKKILVFDVLDSTNTEAKRRVIEGAEHGTVIIAEQQTAGRGRQGRSFFSPEGRGIYLSVIFRPKLSAEQSLPVTAAASVAVCRAIENVTGKQPQIKWVNDLYLKGKKICGILTEAVTGLETGDIEAIIVGIGINCTTVFPNELENIAGSILEKGETKAVRNHLAAELINQTSGLEDMLRTREFLEEYRRKSLVLGRQVTIVQEPGSCYTAEDIGENGELILLDSNGSRRYLNTGEVSIRLTE